MWDALGIIVYSLSLLFAGFYLGKWLEDNKKKKKKLFFMKKDLESLQRLIAFCQTVTNDRNKVADRLKVVLEARLGFEGLNELKTKPEEAYQCLKTEEKELHRFVFQLTKNSLMKANNDLGFWVKSSRNEATIKNIHAWLLAEKSKKEAQNKKKKLVGAVKSTHVNLDTGQKNKLSAENLLHSFSDLQRHLKTWQDKYKNISSAQHMPVSYLGRSKGFPGKISDEIKGVIAKLQAAQDKIDGLKSTKKAPHQKKQITEKKKNTPAKPEKSSNQKEQETSDKQPAQETPPSREERTAMLGKPNQ